MSLIETTARAMLFLLGAALVGGTLFSAVQTFVLPRGANTLLTRWVFLVMRALFGVRLRLARSYKERDSVMALFAPLGLLALPPVWLALVLSGYTAMFWAVGAESWQAAFMLSGSSLFTLGFTPAVRLLPAILTFSEAAIGLVLVALFITYLPTMYAAFSRREQAVALLEVRAGSPPSAVVMIERYHRIHGLAQLNEVWQTWEAWFADIEESHTSLAALAWFRSPRPERSWITAAGAVLDAAALARSTVDVPRDPQADLCIRAGYVALRQIADFFRLPHPADARYPDTAISITRREFDAAYDELGQQSVPLQKDRDQAWRDFAGWRVNYDVVLVTLAGLIMAPQAPWSSDRRMGDKRWWEA